MDDLSTILPAVAGAIGASVTLPLILRTVRAEASVDGNERVLTYGRPLKILTWVFWLFWIGLVGLALFMPKKEPQDGLIAISLVIVFFAMIAVLHVELVGVRIVYDEAGVRTQSPWRHRREIPWSAMRRVSFSQAAQWHVVETSGHGRIRLHVYLNGIESLLEELQRRGVEIK
jgi:hypothetical protein